MYFKFPILQDNEWLKKEVATKPLRQIAEEIGSSYSAITYMVRKYGIKVPVRFNHRKGGMVAWNKGLHPEYTQGPNHPNWRGGRSVRPSGYVSIWKPQHPNASKEGYVMEHRLVMEESIGRYLTKKEAVHHINGNKSDNRLENLHLFSSNGENTKEHFNAVKEVERLRKILDEHGIIY